MALMLIPLALLAVLAYVIAMIHRKTSTPDRVEKGLRAYVADTE